jgi:hypothetical protein
MTPGLVRHFLVQVIVRGDTDHTVNSSEYESRNEAETQLQAVKAAIENDELSALPQWLVVTDLSAIVAATVVEDEAPS